MITTFNKNMLEELINNRGYSISYIAKNIGVNQRTVDRLRKGTKPSIKTQRNLMNFYFYVLFYKRISK